MARRHAAPRRRAARDRRGAALGVAARRRPRLPVLRARGAARARRHADHRHRVAALARARVRDRRAHRLLPVARAAAAPSGRRRCGPGRARARRRAAAEHGDRPRRAVVRLPRVRGGARLAGVGALRLGSLLWADQVAARGARDAADQDGARAVLEAREPRGLRRPALGDARRARRVRARARGRPGAELDREPAVDRHRAHHRARAPRRPVRRRRDHRVGRRRRAAGDPDVLPRHLAGRQGAGRGRLVPDRVPRSAPERPRAVGGHQRRTGATERRAGDGAPAAAPRAAGPG